MEANNRYQTSKPFNTTLTSRSSGDSDQQSYLFNYLLSLLDNLDGVEQARRYHPEGDALYHSLQVFQLAYHSTNDPELWAVALLHDVGKAIDSKTHADIGGEQLEGILSPRIVWLVRRHLDLSIYPKRSRRKWKGTGHLSDLEHIRRWDLAGRELDVEVLSIEEALSFLFENLSVITNQSNNYRE